MLDDELRSTAYCCRVELMQCCCVKGVVHGVTGIVTQPVSGAKQEGVSGFFKGYLSTTLSFLFV